MDNVEHSKGIEAFWEEIERASEERNVEQRRNAIETIAAKLAEEIASSPTAPLFFLLGYALYFHPDRMTSPPIQKRLESALQSALDLDPGYARAHMYLGHQAWDLGRYAEAKSDFQKVDLTQLGSFWGMKVREMLLCCAIATTGLAQSLDDLDEYVRTAEQHSPPDVWPTELYKWVEAGRPLLNDVERERVQPMLERLERAQRLRK